MCAIVGIRSFDKPVSSELVSKMRDCMAHRGPDGSGIRKSGDRRVVFGHRRLSILDLSDEASQPMVNGSEDVWVCFNGEIYNHPELREELRGQGCVFRTQNSDTETLLQAYETWGPRCVNRFRGMFAFAIWDERKEELFLARDPFGIKPLYYGTFGSQFYFASEIKAIIADPAVPRAVNETALYDYLSFLCVPAPDTMFQGISKLPAGHTLRLSANGVQSVEKYWEVFDEAEDLSDLGEKALSERLLAELTDSVKCHALSDVPVGVFLSGGIDSSCNAVLFSRTVSAPVRTFTTGYTGAASYENEFDYARQVAGLVHAEHHELPISAQMFMDFIPQMVGHQDEPLADPVCVPVYFVSKLAAEHGIKVCQVGEGSDELFCGYPLWRQHLSLQRFCRHFWGRTLLKGVSALAAPWRAKHPWPYEFIRRGSANEPTFWSGAEAFPESYKQTMLGPGLLQRLAGYSSASIIERYRREFLRYKSANDHLSWMTFINLKIRLPELLLMRVDKMSMAVSLETRVPFLDRKVVAFSVSVPERVLVKNGELKHLLKRSLRGILPDEILDRKKQGFGAPVKDFYGQGLGETARAVVGRFVQDTDYFDGSFTRQIMSNPSSSGFWYLLNLAMWFQRCITKDTH
jgi:asparagine synthase (glutamine-hydrolysing)